VPRRKDKKRRKQRHWDNDSVERLQKRLAGLEVESKKVAAKLGRLQKRDREIVEEYRDGPNGGIASIAVSHGLSRSTVHRVVQRDRQHSDVGQLPHSEPEPTTAVIPVEEPSPSADGGELDDDLDDGDEETSRPSQQEYDELLGAIEEWMRRLRQQARIYRTRDVTSEGASETEGSAVGRFLTDLAWDMETCIREIARWFT
jgi:hypothetical protein